MRIASASLHFDTSGRYVLAMPSGAKILTVQTRSLGPQFTGAVLFAEVPDPVGVRVVDYVFYVVLTGELVPAVPLTYLGTVSMNGTTDAHIYLAR